MAGPTRADTATVPTASGAADDTPPPTGTGGSRFSILREPDFVRIWATGALGGTMRWLEVLALGLFAISQSDSALVVASMLFARTLPTMLLGAPVGALAERVNRRTLLLCGLAVLVSLSLVLGFVALLGFLELWHAALGALISGAVWSMEHPVRRTMLSDVAGRQRTGVAISLDSTTFNATRMLGPLLGGVAYEWLGMPGVYALGVVFYVIAFTAVATCRFNPPQQPRASSSFRRTIVEGFAYVRGQPSIMAVLIATVVLNMFGFAYVSIAPLIGGKVLGLSATLVGLMLSTEGLGAALGAIALTTVLRPGRYHQLFFCGASLFLVMIFIFGISPHFGLSITVLFLAGIGLALFSAMQSTLLLVSASAEMRSRVMGLLVLAIGSGPPGALMIGAVADWIGPSNAIALMATVGILALTGVVLVWPRLLHLDPRLDVKRSSSQ